MIVKWTDDRRVIGSRAYNLAAVNRRRERRRSGWVACVVWVAILAGLAVMM